MADTPFGPPNCRFYYAGRHIHKTELASSEVSVKNFTWESKSRVYLQPATLVDILMNPMFKPEPKNVYSLVAKAHGIDRDALLHYLGKVSESLQRHNITLSAEFGKAHLVYRTASPDHDASFDEAKHTLVTTLGQLGMDYDTVDPDKNVLKICSIYDDDCDTRTNKLSIWLPGRRATVVEEQSLPQSLPIPSLWLYVKKELCAGDVNIKMDTMFPAELWNYHKNISSLARLLISAFRVALPTHTIPDYIKPLYNGPDRRMIAAAVRHQTVEPPCVIDQMMFLVNSQVKSKVVRQNNNFDIIYNAFEIDKTIDVPGQPGYTGMYLANMYQYVFAILAWHEEDPTVQQILKHIWPGKRQYSEEMVQCLPMSTLMDIWVCMTCAAGGASVSVSASGGGGGGGGGGASGASGGGGGGVGGGGGSGGGGGGAISGGASGGGRLIGGIAYEDALRQVHPTLAGQTVQSDPDFVKAMQMLFYEKYKNEGSIPKSDVRISSSTDGADDASEADRDRTSVGGTKSNDEKITHVSASRSRVIEVMMFVLLMIATAFGVNQWNLAGHSALQSTIDGFAANQIAFQLEHDHQADKLQNTINEKQELIDRLADEIRKCEYFGEQPGFSESSKIQQLQYEQQQLTKQLEEAKSDLAELKASNADLTNKMSSTVSDHNGELQIRDTQIRSLSAKLDTQTKQIDELQKNTTQLTEWLTAAYDDVLHLTIDDALNQHEYAKLAELAGQCKRQAWESVQLLRSTFPDLPIVLNTVPAQLEHLQPTIDLLKHNATQYIRSASQCNATLSDCQAHCTTTIASLTTCQAKLEASKEPLNEIMHELSSLSNSLTAANASTVAHHLGIIRNKLDKCKPDNNTILWEWVVFLQDHVADASYECKNASSIAVVVPDAGAPVVPDAVVPVVPDAVAPVVPDAVVPSVPDSLQACTAELAAANVTVLALRAQVTELVADTTARMEELNSIKADVDTAQTHLLGVIHTGGDQICTTNNASMISELAQLASEKILEAQTKQQTTETELNDTTIKLQALTEKYNNSTAEVDRLHDELYDLDVDLQGTLTDFTHYAEQADDDASAALAIIEDLETNLEITHHTDVKQLANATAVIKHLNLVIKILSKDANNASSLLALQKPDVSGDDRVADLQQQVETLQAELKRTEQERDQTGNEVLDLLTRLESTLPKEQIEPIRQALHDVQSKHRAFTTRLAELETQLPPLREKSLLLDKCCDERDTANLAAQTCVLEKQTLESANESAHTELAYFAQLYQTCSDAEQSTDNGQADAVLQSRIETLKVQRNEFEAKYAELVKKHDRLVAVEETAKQTVQNLEQQIASAQQNLEAQQSAHQRTQSENTALKEAASNSLIDAQEIERLTGELKTAQEQLQAATIAKETCDQDRQQQAVQLEQARAQSLESSTTSAAMDEKHQRLVAAEATARQKVEDLEQQLASAQQDLQTEQTAHRLTQSESAASNETTSTRLAELTAALETAELDLQNAKNELEDCEVQNMNLGHENTALRNRLNASNSTPVDGNSDNHDNKAVVIFNKIQDASLITIENNMLLGQSNTNIMDAFLEHCAANEHTASTLHKCYSRLVVCRVLYVAGLKPMDTDSTVVTQAHLINSKEMLQVFKRLNDLMGSWNMPDFLDYYARQLLPSVTGAHTTLDETQKPVNERFFKASALVNNVTEHVLCDYQQTQDCDMSVTAVAMDDVIKVATGWEQSSYLPILSSQYVTCVVGSVPDYLITDLEHFEYYSQFKTNDTIDPKYEVPTTINYSSIFAASLSQCFYNRDCIALARRSNGMSADTIAQIADFFSKLIFEDKLAIEPYNDYKNDRDSALFLMHNPEFRCKFLQLLQNCSQENKDGVVAELNKLPIEHVPEKTKKFIDVLKAHVRLATDKPVGSQEGLVDGARRGLEYVASVIGLTGGTNVIDTLSATMNTVIYLAYLVLAAFAFYNVARNAWNGCPKFTLIKKFANEVKTMTLAQLKTTPDFKLAILLIAVLVVLVIAPMFITHFSLEIIGVALTWFTHLVAMRVEFTDEKQEVKNKGFSIIKNALSIPTGVSIMAELATLTPAHIGYGLAVQGLFVVVPASAGMFYLYRDVMARITSVTKLDTKNMIFSDVGPVHPMLDLYFNNMNEDNAYNVTWLALPEDIRNSNNLRGLPTTTELPDAELLISTGKALPADVKGYELTSIQRIDRHGGKLYVAIYSKTKVQNVVQMFRSRAGDKKSELIRLAHIDEVLADTTNIQFWLELKVAYQCIKANVIPQVICSSQHGGGKGGDDSVVGGGRKY